jgi:glycine cleavage system transcriptional repressor
MLPNQYLVLSALGPDRSGLVADVSRFLTDRAANIEDSRMAVLGAEFGLQVLISGAPAAIERIVAEAAEIETLGVGVIVRRTKSPEEHRRAAVLPYVVTAEALDHEGIVHAVALAISKMGINIVSLETTAYNAPVTGSPLFRLKAVIDVPQGISGVDLRQAMDDVARVENLDIHVRSLVGQ